MANYRRAHKKQNRASLLAVALLLAVLALVGLLAALLGGTGRSGQGSALDGAASVQQGPLPDIDTLRQTSHPEEEFHYLLNGAPAFDSRGQQGSVYLENCRGNTGYMQVVYRLESGQEVYQSPLLAPGCSLQTDSLSAGLGAGEYSAVAQITVYSSSAAQEELGRFEQDVIITVG